MMRFILLILIVLVPSFAMAETTLPRTLIALYDSKEEPLARETDIHSLLELPANHLGYFFRYHDIRSGTLPALGDDVAGVVVWFNPGVTVPNEEAWLGWLKQEVLVKQKRLLLFGSLGIGQQFRESSTGLAQINQVMHAIGVHDENRWIDIVYGAKPVMQDAHVMNFERALSGQLFPYLQTTLAAGGARSYLSVANPTEHTGKAELVVTGPQGGYVAYNYAVSRLMKENSKRVTLQQWLIDPFTFLQTSLGLKTQPIPDATTLFGRRVAYVEMDGDGWNNYSALLEHRNEKVLSAEAALEKIIRPYPDIPFSVGMIGAELDSDCYGLRNSERLGRAIAQQTNVEVASHGYSHVQYWNYFAHGDVNREKALLRYYPEKPSQQISFIARLKAIFKSDPWKDVATPTDTKDSAEEITFLKEAFDYLPRSYACAPFDLKHEIGGAKDYLQSLNPEKPVRLMHWSGDTSPFPAARAEVAKAGMVGLGGGLTRFILDYPSISMLAPYGYVEGADVQLYASNGNENALRSTHEDHFSGLRYMSLFARQTEAPRRLLPLNLYFHTSDAGNPLALQAVLENIAYVRNGSFLRMYAGDYARMAHQFYQVKINQISENEWNVSGVSEPITMRIPNASRKTLDLNRSKGVWGQRYLQGNLYVQLASKGPYVIALKDKSGLELYPAAVQPYVIESSWPIKSLRISKSSLIVAADGFGLGAMRWRMPAIGTYRIRTVGPKGSNAAASEQQVTTGNDGVLQFTLVESNAVPLTIHVEQKD